jgi:hypothetical protein
MESEHGLAGSLGRFRGLGRDESKMDHQVRRVLARGAHRTAGTAGHGKPTSEALKSA